MECLVVYHVATGYFDKHFPVFFRYFFRNIVCLSRLHCKEPLIYGNRVIVKLPFPHFRLKGIQLGGVCETVAGEVHQYLSVYRINYPERFIERGVKFLFCRFFPVFNASGKPKTG